VRSDSENNTDPSRLDTHAPTFRKTIGEKQCRETGRVKKTLGDRQNRGPDSKNPSI
jgi:hypothetical protein